MKVKQNIQGTNQKPRLSVFRSNNNIYVQAINDIEGTTFSIFFFKCRNERSIKIVNHVRCLIK